MEQNGSDQTLRSRQEPYTDAELSEATMRGTGDATALFEADEYEKAGRFALDAVGGVERMAAAYMLGIEHGVLMAETRAGGEITRLTADERKLIADFRRSTGR